MWNRLMIRDNKKTYMTDDIVRRGALNCFEELTSTNKQLNSITGLSLGAKTFFCDERDFSN
jgi:hypothetical protein